KILQITPLKHLYTDNHAHNRATALTPLSLHDALPISVRNGSASLVGSETPVPRVVVPPPLPGVPPPTAAWSRPILVTALASEISHRKSTRLNSSHVTTAYAVFCLKKQML